MIYYKNIIITSIKISTKYAVDHIHKLTGGLIFTMQFPMATVKKKRISSQSETVEELRARITEAYNFITVRHLQNTRKNFQDRLGNCLAVEGKHFEQFL
jgi:hypothetical protein